jgi:ribosomal protein L35
LVLAPKKKGAGDEAEEGSSKAGCAKQDAPKPAQKQAEKPAALAAQQVIVRVTKASARRATRRHMKKKEQYPVPKMKSKKSAAKRFRIRPGGSIKRSQGLHAPHPDQEDHQAEAPPARSDRGARQQQARSPRDAAVQLRSAPCHA